MKSRAGLAAIALVAGGLALWEALARSGHVPVLFFPAPSRIFETLVRLGASGELSEHVAITVRRVGVGFALGAVIGLPLGWLAGWSPRMRQFLDPLVAALHPLPKVALLPLLMVIFGVGDRASTLAVAAAAFFPLMINTMAGVEEIPAVYFEVARSFGARPWSVFRRVVLLGSLPAVLTGVRLAVNVALLVTIAVELVSSEAGLGNRIWFAWETFRTEELWAYLVVISVLGMVMAGSIALSTRWLVPWRREERSRREASLERKGRDSVLPPAGDGAALKGGLEGG